MFELFIRYEYRNYARLVIEMNGLIVALGARELRRLEVY